jgi:hypothetical protein
VSKKRNEKKIHLFKIAFLFFSYKIWKHFLKLFPKINNQKWQNLESERNFFFRLGSVMQHCRKTANAHYLADRRAATMEREARARRSRAHHITKTLRHHKETRFGANEEAKGRQAERRRTTRRAVGDHRVILPVYITHALQKRPL